MYGGVWPLCPRAAVGSPGYEKWGFSSWASGRGTACLPSSAHLLTVPGGLASGAQPRRFQNGIRSSAAGGREGAGRGGGPASWAVLRRALASSCLCCECGSGSEWVSRGGMPVAAARWAWRGYLPYCRLQVSGQGPLASPFPGQSLLWRLRCGTGPWGLGHRAPGLCCVPTPSHHSCSLEPSSGFGPSNPCHTGWA